MDKPQIVDVFRYDRIGIKGKVKKTDEGYMLASAAIAKEGIYTYHLMDGTTRKELVDSETLSNVESNDSLKLKPVTNNHPRERTINSYNSKMRSVGSVGETISNDDGFLMANFSITDSSMVDSINKGQKQLSPGYKVDLVMTPGTHNGEHYDAIQRNRRYNHLAIVDNARGGSELQLNIDHMDSDDAVVDGIHISNSKSNNDKNKESRSMDQVTYNVDGLGYNADPQIVNHISKLDIKIASLEKNILEANKATSTAEGKADAAEDKLKTMEKIDTDDVIAKAVKVRITLEQNASKVLKEDKFDGMNNAEIMKKVVLKKFPDAKEKIDSKDDVYLEARYDSVVENIDEESFAKQKKIVFGNGPNKDKPEEKEDSVTAHADMVEYNKNLWKKDRKEYA